MKKTKISSNDLMRTKVNAVRIQQLKFQNQPHTRPKLLGMSYLWSNPILKPNWYKIWVIFLLKKHVKGEVREQSYTNSLMLWKDLNQLNGKTVYIYEVLSRKNIVVEFFVTYLNFLHNSNQLCVIFISCKAMFLLHYFLSGLLEIE